MFASAQLNLFDSHHLAGLYHRGRCPKGDVNCNFLHVFLNPGETVAHLHKALWLQLGALPPEHMGNTSKRNAKTDPHDLNFSSSDE